MQKILFVCLGNICRSPTAEGVMRSLVAAQGRQDEFFLDSAGTGDWHVGQAPDRRAQAACRRAGIDISSHRAGRVRREDFQKFDLILACDRENLRDLRAMMPEGSGARLAMLRDYSTETPGADVPESKPENVEPPKGNGAKIGWIIGGVALAVVAAALIVILTRKKRK